MLQKFACICTLVSAFMLLLQVWEKTIISQKDASHDCCVYMLVSFLYYLLLRPSSLLGCLHFFSQLRLWLSLLELELSQLWLCLSSLDLELCQLRLRLCTLNVEFLSTFGTLVVPTYTGTGLSPTSVVLIHSKSRASQTLVAPIFTGSENFWKLEMHMSGLQYIFVNFTCACPD